MDGYLGFTSLLTPFTSPMAIIYSSMAVSIANMFKTGIVETNNIDYHRSFVDKSSFLRMCIVFFRTSLDIKP